MMNHPTIDRLGELKLNGMQQGLIDQEATDGIEEMSFHERLGLLVDREATERAGRSLTRRLQRAHLRENAAIEDVDFRVRRGLDRGQFLALASCDWIRDHLNVLITGPTGTGKTYLACALAQKACREGYSVLYTRLPRLLGDLTLAHADGRYPKLMIALARTHVLILDDWGFAPMTERHRYDLAEIIEERDQLRSTIITSQYPVQAWHDAVGDPTIADATLDRIVHAAYRFELECDSIRKRRARKKGRRT
jgi:DNA replication protein DnaC